MGARVPSPASWPPVIAAVVALVLLCGPRAQVAGQVAADAGLGEARRQLNAWPPPELAAAVDALPRTTTTTAIAAAPRRQDTADDGGPRRRHGRGRRGPRPHDLQDHLHDGEHGRREGNKKRQQQQQRHHHHHHHFDEAESPADADGRRKHKKAAGSNRTAPEPAAPEDRQRQQVRHRKQRQSRRKDGERRRDGGRRRKNETAPGRPPPPPPAADARVPDDGDANGTIAFRRRSEEKQELVGRRTLQVLSPRGAAPASASRPTAPSPALVGILDIPAVLPGEATAVPGPHKHTTVFKAAGKPAGVRGHGQGGHGGRRRTAAAAGKPLDPDWLQKLLSAAAAAAPLPPPPGTDADDMSPPSPCDRWLNCSAQLKSAVRAQLSQLPACPCSFPANVFYYNKIWDPQHARYFRWRDASGRAERLDVYHPGAAHCIRSLHSASAGILGAQHCCYDRDRQLLTRGSGAGTPALVSPDVSAALHDTLDVRPWRLCKGDFTRYNELRPPNNNNNCGANPGEAEFQRQAALSQFY